MFLDPGKCFGFWEVFWDPGKCFGFWEVFLDWILGSVMDSGKCFVPMGHRTNFVNLVMRATGSANPNKSQFVNERNFRSLRSYFSTHPHLPSISQMT